MKAKESEGKRRKAKESEGKRRKAKESDGTLDMIVFVDS